MVRSSASDGMVWYGMVWYQGSGTHRLARYHWNSKALAPVGQRKARQPYLPSPAQPAQCEGHTLCEICEWASTTSLLCPQVANLKFTILNASDCPWTIPASASMPHMKYF